MSDKNDIEKKMEQWVEESAEEADKILANEMEVLRRVTTSDLNALKPKVSDKETFDVLIAAVEESTIKNENLADFKMRIEKLGPKVLGVFREVVDLINKA